MDVDVIRPGDLADDERTETERSPVIEKIPAVPGEDDNNQGNVDIEAIDQAPNGDADEDANGRKNCSKKHRRGKNKGGKRHWKPYNKLSWEERKALEERESRRATRKRQQRFANGQPMAPYNTTQFLMEQHQADDPDYKIEDSLRPRNDAAGDANGSGSVDSSEEYIDSPEDDDLFMAKDFSETYDSVHAERLQNMTKEELVRELIELESRVERLEKKDDATSRTSAERASLDSAGNGTTESVMNVTANVLAPNNSAILHLNNSNNTSQPSDISKKASFEAEIIRLRQENEKLRLENAKLRLASEGGRSPNA